MGHAAHFLSRLERLRGDAQLELALGLYRDPRAVRIALAGSADSERAPDADERVAIALADGRKPPHIIVTREGRFVTCLGPGMRVGDVQVVPRDVAQAAIEASARTGRVEDRVELRGGLFGLFERLLEAGVRLAREDFEALFALAPLLERALLKLWHELHLSLAEIRRNAGARQRARRDKAMTRVMERYGDNVEAMGHVLMLFGALDLDQMLARIDAQPERVLDPLTAPAFVLLQTGPMIRAAWLAGRMGPRLESSHRRRWREAEGYLQAAQSAMSLVAIAVRHPEFAPSVLGVLADRSAPVFTDPAHEMDATATEALVQPMLLAMRAPEVGWQALREAMLSCIVSVEGQPDPTLDDLPMALAGPWMIAQSESAFGENPDMFMWLGMLTVWAADKEAADLYVPAAHLRRMRFTPAIERARDNIRYNQEYFGRKVPAHKKVRVGRNDPCPCGSGRKYKRCCLRKS